MMYWTIGAGWALLVGLLLAVRFPNENRPFHETAEALPQGEGLAPVRD